MSSLTEPRLLADERMQHPNIVRIWDADCLSSRMG